MAAVYDPQARRERYLRERQLQGRQKSAKDSIAERDKRHAAQNKGRVPAKKPPPKKSPPKDSPAQATARVARLEAKVASLQGALTKAMAALAEKRRSAKKTEKKNSDGKTTAKERQDSKEYRDKHKQELAAKRKAKSDKSGGGSSSKSVSDMSTDELQSRISKIRVALASAKSQLSAARTAAGQLAHSDNEVLVLRHTVPEAERNPSHMKPDFGGFATRHDVECADGRTILPGAFQGNDGLTVPLVYGHDHNGIENVLGHCVLEYKPEGVYAHGYFNETPNGQIAKQQVAHGDLKFLSIFANNLKEKARDGLRHAKDVLSGNIREVSLVLAGANPGAFIDNLTIAHSDGSIEDGDEAVMGMFAEIEVGDALAHADSGDGRSLQDILDTLNDEQATAVNYLLSQQLEDSAVAHDGLADDADHNSEESESSAEDEESNEGENGADEVGAEDTEAGEGASDNEGDADGVPDSDNHEAGEIQHDNSQEDNSMTHNVFTGGQGGAATARPQASLAHGALSQEDALQKIVKFAKRNGSLKEAIEDYIEHTGVMVGGTLQHGIENIEYLFPDAQTLENTPAFISRRMEWVDTVLSSVRKSPFSRIKTITADITPDEARARGYIKGNFKNEEFFALSKRTTDPQTVYKKQKLDRDDVIDIVNLDVVAWLKAEMKVMLDEEIAGAILVGDGRSIGHEDKILENHIRPIASDAELYVTTVNVNLGDADSTVEELVDAAIANRRYYKGSGTPTFFTTESTISAFLTVKDNFGRRLYANLNEVAAVLRVAAVVPVEIMERVPDLVGIMVNLSDYVLGADRGGQATMFDDFDIDYNKLRYLIETRLSGALVTPKAAIVFRKVAATSQLATPEQPDFDGTTVTVPTVTGVTYKNADTNATLTTASPVAVAEGATLNVVATPNSGYYFGNSEDDSWSFTNEAGA